MNHNSLKIKLIHPKRIDTFINEFNNVSISLQQKVYVKFIDNIDEYYYDLSSKFGNNTIANKLFKTLKSINDNAKHFTEIKRRIDESYSNPGSKTNGLDKGMQSKDELWRESTQQRGITYTELYRRRKESSRDLSRFIHEYVRGNERETRFQPGTIKISQGEGSRYIPDDAKFQDELDKPDFSILDELKGRYTISQNLEGSSVTDFRNPEHIEVTSTVDTFLSKYNNKLDISKSILVRTYKDNKKNINLKINCINNLYYGIYEDNFP